MEIIFATGNANKLKEVKALLGEQFQIKNLKDIGFEDDIPEPYKTIEENSAHKAQTIYDLYKINVMAEDTGLEVEALDGAPGVYSARYAGWEGDPSQKAQKNMDKLLSELAKLEESGNTTNPSNRKAHFKTVATLILDGKQHQFTGILEGEIIDEARGDNGFGYDPVFKVAGSSKTLAEITSKEKNTISHRALAFKQLIDFLNRNIGE